MLSLSIFVAVSGVGYLWRRLRALAHSVPKRNEDMVFF